MYLSVCVQGGDAIQDQTREVEDEKKKEVKENQ